MNQIKNLSLFGICFAFVVIALGAWTRLVDAGLGCPDWPGCYGFVVFPINEADIAIAESRYPLFPYDINKAIPEVVHRYFAAALGLLAIFLVYLSFRRSDDRSIQGWSSFLLFFICCQGFWILNSKFKTFANNSNTAFIWGIYYAYFVLLYLSKI